MLPPSLIVFLKWIIVCQTHNVLEKVFAQGEGGVVVGKVWKISICWNISLICSLGPSKMFYCCHPLGCIYFVLPWREVPHVSFGVLLNILWALKHIPRLIPTQQTSPVDKISKYQHSTSNFSLDKQSELSWSRLKVNAMAFAGDASSKKRVERTYCEQYVYRKQY